MGKNRYFIFRGEELLLQSNKGKLLLPETSKQKENVFFIGVLDGYTYYTYSAGGLDESLNEFVPVSLWESRKYLGESLFRFAGKSYEYHYWKKHSEYCSSCGTHTEQATEISKLCPVCKIEIFPRITTAVLALVRRNDEILLVHAHTFNNQFHSIITGFLEIGESLEECVCREVKEETGIEVTNVTYFGSQSWPFPSGLMIGFIADYLDGEINLQKEELSDGRFYSKSNLPRLPPKHSLSRDMINWWICNS